MTDASAPALPLDDGTHVPLPPGGHSAGAGLWRRLLLLLLGLRHARAVAHAPSCDAGLLPAHGTGLAHARAVVRHALRRAVGAGGAPTHHDGRRRLGSVPSGRGRGAAGLLPALQRLRAHRRLLGRHAAPALHARERAVAPAAALLLRVAGHRGHRGYGFCGVRGQAGGLVLAHGLRRRHHVSAVAGLACGGARLLIPDEDRAAGFPRGEPD
ncbi:hypothetical protein ON010_g12335 [Phytophthora cinnamomi]|nr:hypothetical protein ON010_g12335 [Phytophthora cinnamomi]